MSAIYHPTVRYLPHQCPLNIALEIGLEIEIARGGFVILYVFPQPEVRARPERVGFIAILGPT